ncbi:M12 family metallopeptidase [Granulosicoccaceae sp. 1_MG-2023]|nr:M12 family metallopeptidase [Granulosicoccaceae sp. 1_MG-2023]
MTTRIKPVAPSLICCAVLLAAATPANAGANAKTSVTLNLPDGHYTTYQTELINGVAVAEGDILLSRADDSDALSTRGFANNLTANLWFDGIVPFVLDKVSDEDTLSHVNEAIEHWNLYSSVRFQEVTREDIDNGLVVDYLEFTPYEGCSSYVGRIGGAQPVWVSSSCTSGSIIHELGHAIGLLHEHTRTDRDQYIRVNEENVMEGKLFNFAIPDSTVSDLGDYDYGSIMHYGPTSFSANGEDTISALQDISGINMGQRIRLSDGDLGAVDELYGTDLALAEYSDGELQSGATVAISATISNNGDMGANEVVYALEVPTGSTLSTFDGEDWDCDNQAGAIVCTRDTLVEGSVSQLDLSVTLGATVPETLAGYITSRTFDTETSNNGNAPQDYDVDEARADLFDEPVLGAATSQSNYTSASASGSAAGAAGPLIPGVLLLLLHWRRGRRQHS